MIPSGRRHGSGGWSGSAAARAALGVFLVLLLVPVSGASTARLAAQDPAPPRAQAPAPAPVGRDVVEALEFPDLDFDPPDASEYSVLQVPVFHLHDATLPLVDFQLLVRGGIANFPRERLGTLSALPFAVRNGGTVTLPPDSVDRRIDLLALQISVSRGGGGTAVALNTLSERIDPGLELLREMLLEPRFDPNEIEVWRGRELESVRRRRDNPTGLAFSEFNRLMYGDHPVGWVTTEDDLDPERLTSQALRDAHGELYCRDRLILGVSGDLTWDEAEPRVRRFLEAWPECPNPLPEPPRSDLRGERGVFILPRDLDQTTVVMAGPSDVQQADSPEYFASRIANYLLGGRGFSSRILERVRTEEGLTYGAASVWTTPLRSSGIVGAFASTRSDQTLEMTHLLLEILDEFRDDPPDRAEMDEAVEEIASGYVFGFESAAQIVARRMSFRAQRLPDGWLERYLEGLREVTEETMRATVRDHLHPDRMTILLVGDAQQFGPGVTGLGPVFELTPDGEPAPRVSPEPAPDGSPRSPR